MQHNILYPVLRNALATRNVTTLHRLYRVHGAHAFADALSHCSSRVAADALSLLNVAERLRVLHRLPSQARVPLRPLYRINRPQDMRIPARTADACPGGAHAC